MEKGVTMIITCNGSKEDNITQNFTGQDTVSNRMGDEIRQMTLESTLFLFCCWLKRLKQEKLRDCIKDKEDTRCSPKGFRYIFLR